MPMIDNAPLPLIHDGDHGGDDFITTLVLLSRPDLFALKGITVTHGNVSADLAAQNACRALTFSGLVTHIPVHAGHGTFNPAAEKEDDNAFSSNGLGGIELPQGQHKVSDGDALNWLKTTLSQSLEPFTILATGPLTNIACLLRDAPELKNKIARLIIMGGGDKVAGNIKPYAEFNFYKDPEAADFVLKNDVPIILHTLDSNHALSFNPSRQARIKALEPRGTYGDILCRMMRIVEELDMKGFGSDGAFIHDIHTALCLIRPDLYETRKVRAHVKKGDDPEAGRLVIEGEDDSSTLQIVKRMTDPDQVFDLLVACLERLPYAASS